jgi:hypothetical protein
MNAPLERIAEHLRAASRDLRLDLAKMDVTEAERAVVRAREEYEAATAAFNVAVKLRDEATPEAKPAAQKEMWRRREFMRLAEFQLDRRRGLEQDAKHAYWALAGDPIDNAEAFANVDIRAELGGVISD